MVEYFLSKGHSVVALDRFFFGDVLNEWKGNSKLVVVKDDTRIFDKKYLQGVDTVIELASLSNDPSSDLNPSITDSINHLGPLRVALLAKEMKVRKFIFSSSCSVYGANDFIVDEKSPVNPVSEYGKSKVNAEIALQKLSDDKFSVTFLRNATVYGLSKRRMRFDLVVNMMTLHAWKNGKIYIMGGGKQWRPLVHIYDVIKAFELVMSENDTTKINKKIFNVGSDEQNYQIFQLANMFKKQFSGINVEVTPDDPDPRNYRVNFEKIKKELKFKPAKNIEDGITEIKAALEKGQINDSVRTNTSWYYKYLIEADKILSAIKINNELFEI